MLFHLNNVTVYCGFLASEGFNLFGCDSCVAAAGKIFCLSLVSTATFLEISCTASFGSFIFSSFYFM